VCHAEMMVAPEAGTGKSAPAGSAS
jgi:hypothetical protein